MNEEKILILSLFEEAIAQQDVPQEYDYQLDSTDSTGMHWALCPVKHNREN